MNVHLPSAREATKRGVYKSRYTANNFTCRNSVPERPDTSTMGFGKGTKEEAESTTDINYLQPKRECIYVILFIPALNVAIALNLFSGDADKAINR